MGGDSVVSHDREDDLSYEQDFSMLSTSQTPSYLRDAISMKVDSIQRQILRSYDDLRNRSKDLEEEKKKILSYNPGAWIEKVGCLKLHDYDVPPTTSLILIGPRGSGKSSLINRISKAFEYDKLISARAQVSYNPYVGDGTIFLREYMIPRESTSFCLYDTRSLSDDISENNRVLIQWINQGVRHGQLVTWDTEGESVRKTHRMKDVHSGCLSSEIRPVNFVIFVVNGLSVLKCLESAWLTDYEKIIASTFHLPQLSYQDDKPVVVFTHGDMLSLSERAHVRAHLAELLGIPPTEQIFDIPDSDDPETQLAIMDMLRYSLEHAERNFPQKIRNANKVWPRKKERCEETWSSFIDSHLSTITFLACIIMLISLVIFDMRNAKDSVNPQFHVYDDAQGHANITHTSKNHAVIPRVKPNTGQHADSSAKSEEILQMEPNAGEHAASYAKPEVIPQMEPNTGEHAASCAKPEVIPLMEPNAGEHAASCAKPEVIPQMEPNTGEHAGSSAKPEVVPQLEHNTGQSATASSKPEVIPQVEPKVDEHAACFAEPEEVRQVKTEKNGHAAFFAKPEKSHETASKKHGDIPKVKRRKNQHTASFGKHKEIAKEVKVNWHAIRHLWYDGE